MSAPAKQIGVAIVEDSGRYLVGIRPEGSSLAGYAEFPGGKLEPGEVAQACAIRECFEEAGLLVEAIEEIDQVEWEYPHGRVELHFIRCRVACKNSPTHPFRWVTANELATLQFPEANARVVSTLLAGVIER